nr:portal protein [Staphylococcus phage S-CoN_Ph38]
MIMGIRRPRTDIYSSGYGLSELEIALKQVIAHENTESFNDRFFSHGGTTRGVLLIKHEQQQSQYALENFKREWKSSLSGINGSWQIPVVSADDVKFVNMTPTANDMQFEKWLNYLINVICSVYEIDPSGLTFLTGVVLLAQKLIHLTKEILLKSIEILKIKVYNHYLNLLKL